MNLISLTGFGTIRFMDNSVVGILYWRPPYIHALRLYSAAIVSTPNFSNLSVVDRLESNNLLAIISCNSVVYFAMYSVTVCLYTLLHL